MREVNVTTGATTTTVGTCGSPPRTSRRAMATNDLKTVSFNLLVAAVVSRTEGGAARRVYYILESSAIWRIQPDAPSSAAFVIYNTAVGSEFDPTAAVTVATSDRAGGQVLLIVVGPCNTRVLEPAANGNQSLLSTAISPADMTLTDTIVPPAGGLLCQKGRPILEVAIGIPNSTMLYVAVSNGGSSSSSSQVTRSPCTAYKTSSSDDNASATTTTPSNRTTAAGAKASPTPDEEEKRKIIVIAVVVTFGGSFLLAAAAAACYVHMCQRQDEPPGQRRRRRLARR